MAQLLLSNVASRAKAVLSRSRIFDLRKLLVEEEGDTVVLRGRVDWFYHKQLAQELVKATLENVEVVNDIQVAYRRERIDEEFDWQ